MYIFIIVDVEAQIYSDTDIIRVHTYQHILSIATIICLMVINVGNNLTEIGAGRIIIYCDIFIVKTNLIFLVHLYVITENKPSSSQ